MVLVVMWSVPMFGLAHNDLVHGDGRGRFEADVEHGRNEVLVKLIGPGGGLV